MQIDIEKIGELVKNSDKIFLKPEAEENLIKLLELRNQIDKAIDEAKVLLESKAMEIDQNFTSLVGDKVKIYYRSFGSRWIPDESLLEYLPKDYYTTETKIKLDTKKVEKHIKDTGKIPAGVKEVERPKSITFSYKGEDNEV